MNNRHRQIRKARRMLWRTHSPVEQIVMGIDWDAFRRALSDGIEALKAMARRAAQVEPTIKEVRIISEEEWNNGQGTRQMGD